MTKEAFIKLATEKSVIRIRTDEGLPDLVVMFLIFERILISVSYRPLPTSPNIERSIELSFFRSEDNDRLFQMYESSMENCGVFHDNSSQFIAFERKKGEAYHLVPRMATHLRALSEMYGCLRVMLAKAVEQRIPQNIKAAEWLVVRLKGFLDESYTRAIALI